jgi:hypothetical protein
MKLPAKIQTFLTYLLVPVLLDHSSGRDLLRIDSGEIPLTVGDTSPYDITASRSIPRQVSHRPAGQQAAADVEIVVVRSEAIVAEVMGRFDLFFDQLAARRTEIFPEPGS